MCGIIGFAQVEPEPRRDRISKLRDMGRWMVYRGPDSWGEFVADEVALGHNRLAIIDIQTGQQPMQSPCGRATIVFNGEIYNYQKLWTELRARGLAFRTDHSDTEVILNGYLECGEAIFERLVGMFAIAIWDAASRRLVLARDRLGIKPLYYAPLPGGNLVFASEPKAIVGSGFVPSRVRVSGIAEYFFFRAPCGPHTLLEGIHKVPPGHVISWTSTGLNLARCFWRREAAPEFQSDEEALAEVERVLDRAVTTHLMADVPVGSFLSGGVDSSLMVAIAGRSCHVDTFTIGTDSEWDETDCAAETANLLGVPHRILRLQVDDFATHLSDWLYVNDDPCADPSALAMLLLSRFAAQSGIKVILTGEGSDEIFGGYNAYSRYVILGFLRGIPLARLAAGFCCPLMHPRSSDYMAMTSDNFLGTGHLADLRTLSQLLAPGRGDDVHAVLAICKADRSPGPRVRRAMRLDQRTRLPDDLLMRTDRASMYYSIEARVPFLDHHVVECADRLTRFQCIGRFGRPTKRLLKQLAVKFFPPHAVHRRKRGFDLPLGDWLRARFLPMLASYQAESRIESLNYKTIAALLTELRAGANTVSGVLWAWLILEGWYRTWIDGKPEPRCPSRLQGLDGYRQLHSTAAGPPAACPEKTAFD